MSPKAFRAKEARSRVLIVLGRKKSENPFLFDCDSCHVVSPAVTDVMVPLLLSRTFRGRQSMFKCSSAEMTSTAFLHLWKRALKSYNMDTLSRGAFYWCCFESKIVCCSVIPCPLQICVHPWLWVMLICPPTLTLCFLGLSRNTDTAVIKHLSCSWFQCAVTSSLHYLDYSIWHLLISPFIRPLNSIDVAF